MFYDTFQQHLFFLKHLFTLSGTDSFRGVVQIIMRRLFITIRARSVRTQDQFGCVFSMFEEMDSVSTLMGADS